MASALIGIMGLKQSGKDTYASRLVAAHGFTRYALADPMRDFALALDPMIDLAEGHRIGVVVTRLSEYVEKYGWEYAKKFPEVRRTLQRLGTEAGRNVIGEDFWISVTDKKVQANPGPVVVTDIRFPNEYEWVCRNGGLLVRVVRPGQEAEDVHISEALAVDFDGHPADCTVLNSTTIEDLHEHADLLARVLAKQAKPTAPSPEPTLF